MIPVVLAVLGVLLVAGGLALCPWPWLALVWLGAAMCVVGLLFDFEGGAE